MAAPQPQGNFRSALQDIQPLSTAAELNQPNSFIHTNAEGRGGEGQISVYSTVGKQPLAAFEAAVDQYHKDGKDPAGFTVLKAGSAQDWLREKYEKLNQPLQAQTQALDTDSDSRINMIPEGPLRSIAKSALQIPAESVSTPRKAGMTAATMAIAPALGPVSIASGVGKVALSKAGLLGNIIKTAVAGTTGSTLVDAALGSPEPFHAGKVIGDLALSGSAGTAQGVMGHFINKYISPDMHETVAKNVFDKVAASYPNYKTDPTLFEAAMSSPKKIEEMVHIGAKGMTDTFKGYMDNFKDAILGNVNMRRGEQATLRAYLRRVGEAGDDIIDNVIAGKTADDTAINKAIVDAGTFVVGEMKKAGIKDISGKMAQFSTVMKGFKDNLTNFNEGANFLSALQRSGQGNGFDAMELRKALMDANYRAGGNQSLMSRVGKELGFGQSLSETATAPEMANPLERFVLSKMRGIPLLNKVTPDKAPAQQYMPWMLQKGPLPQTIGIGVESTGRDAIESFMKSSLSGSKPQQ